MIDEMPYLVLGEEYGWTPEQIDRMPVDFVKKALIYISAKNRTAKKFLKEVENVIGL